MGYHSSQVFTEAWLRELQESSDSNSNDDPNYWASNPQTLVSSSEPIRFSVGTGQQLLSSILSKCLATRQELVIVTCFWAKSSSQEAVASLLSKLSAKAIAQDRIIRVRLCFSSLSILQKLFQTSNLDGKIYPPSSWEGLGLPSPNGLRGLQLVVKSVFVRPFSVMHPKFILMDREVAFMPSCNVSWENWFEGCIEMRCGAVGNIFTFWESFWSRGGASLPALVDHADLDNNLEPASDTSIAHVDFHLSKSLQTTILLPCSHHINPQFRLFSSPPPPKTPLNVFILQALAQAKNNVYIQTPNLTSSPFIAAILTAVSRGINLHLVTSSRLMTLEQLVTAGTFTEFEIWKLQRRYRRVVKEYNETLRRGRSDSEGINLMEKPGDLNIWYYKPRKHGGRDEPAKSHLKCVVIDNEIVVLGSGNMDRASWFTSQELGIAFFSPEMAREVKAMVGKALQRRVRMIE